MIVCLRSGQLVCSFAIKKDGGTVNVLLVPAPNTKDCHADGKDSRYSILNMLIEGRIGISIRTPHPLTAEEIETLRLWVDQGAINN